MGLKLENGFTVAAPIETTWSTLLDIERVARCMPGAQIEPGGADGVYRGTMTVKLGPVTVAYRGTARLAEVDADDHVCVIDLKAKEQHGQGTAAATITNRLVADGDGTRVVVETDLAVTGRQAQFGRGIMEDVSAKMLADFAGRLEREVVGSHPAGDGRSDVAAAPPAAGAPAAPPRAVSPSTAANAAPDILDLGAVAAGPIAKRTGAAVGLAALLATVAWILRRGRPRRGLELRLRYR